MLRSKLWIVAGAALLMAACSGKEKLPEEKIPLQVEASLSGQVQTKASAGDFAEGDKILVYLRHMNGTTPVTVDRAPLLAGFTMDANQNPVPDTPLYWDDFSSNKEDGLDIREAGHGLEAYYAYCYNGGTPVSLKRLRANWNGKWVIRHRPWLCNKPTFCGLVRSMLYRFAEPSICRSGMP